MSKIGYKKHDLSKYDRINPFPSTYNDERPCGDLFWAMNRRGGIVSPVSGEKDSAHGYSHFL